MAMLSSVIWIWMMMWAEMLTACVEAACRAFYTPTYQWRIYYIRSLLPGSKLSASKYIEGRRYDAQNMNKLWVK